MSISNISIPIPATDSANAHPPYERQWTLEEFYPEVEMKKITDVGKEELVEKTFKEVIRSLVWQEETVRDFIGTYDNEYQDAMLGHSGGTLVNSFGCQDSFMSDAPLGEEKGKVYVIAFGSTVLRILNVNFYGRGEHFKLEEKTHLDERNVSKHTPRGLLDKNTTATELFDTMADLLKTLMKRIGDDDMTARRRIAFMCAFPVEQTSMAHGVLLNWTKGFETGNDTDDPVVGRDVTVLLTAALKRAGLIHTKVGWTGNDTIGTMMAGSYQHNLSVPTVRCAAILGTGFNVAGMDPAAHYYGYYGAGIVHSCGNYDGVKKFQTPMDIELDYFDQAGANLTEKMVGGRFLGELCRLSILKVFTAKCPDKAYVRNCLTTQMAAKIYGDVSKTYTKTKEVLKKCLGWSVKDDTTLKYVFKIVNAVFDRSAIIGACCVIVAANRTRCLSRGMGGISVAIEGNLYMKNPKYRRSFRKTIDHMLGPRGALLNIVTTVDGSGLGAAAAIVHERAKDKKLH